MSFDPAAGLARLRGLALALPGAVEKISHGMPVFFIEKGRTFAWWTHDHHGCGITAVIVKVAGIDEHATLVERDPALFYRPAYFRADQWIGIRVDLPDTDWAYLGSRIETSWAMVAPARLRVIGR